MNTNINARDYLEKCGIKPSLQRIAIVEYLMENRIHPTADDIYHALCIQVPTLSKTTVYNTDASVCRARSGTSTGYRR